MGGGEHTYENEPATLHKVMQETIGFGLQKRYQAEKEVPHDLLVLMMQINDNNERSGK